jgi:hypothetical protein
MVGRRIAALTAAAAVTVCLSANFMESSFCQ